MKFIKKKNMMAGEELLYTPHLHWAYAVKHLILSLPLFILLLVMWLVADNSYSPSIGDFELAMSFQVLLRLVFFACLLVVLVVFICRIFMYLCTEYGLTNKRLMFKKGVFRLFVSEIPTDRIESIYCVQGILGRIFHYGDLYVSGIGGTKPAFYMVARPYALRRKIVDVVERNKTINVVHGDIPQVAVKAEPVVKPEPIYRYGTFIRILPEGET